MIKANNPQDYKAKVKRREDALSHIESDHVPVMLMSVTWPFGLAGIDVAETIKDRKKLNEYGLAPLDTVYVDLYAGGMFSAPIESYDVLKPEIPQYFISADGYTMQHREISPMKEDEYSLLSTDVKAYLENVILPRRYPILNRPYPENYLAIKEAFPKILDYMGGMMNLAERQEKDYGVPSIIGGNGYAPMDYLMDFLRGFKGLTVDMRRRPEEMKKGLDCLADYLIGITYGPTLKKGGLLLLPIHVPPYLSPKQFEEFYWPSFKKFVDTGVNKGIRVICGLEADWTPHIEHLLDFPKNMIGGTLEYTDIFKAKKTVGDHITLIGGMPCALLRKESPDECVELTKRLVDEVGAGGGYIFSTDVMLMSKNDIKLENFKACTDVILSR